MSTGAWVAVISVAVAIAVGVVTFWDHLFRRPKFDARFEWGSNQYGPVLDVVVRNVGTKQGAIQALYFQTTQPDPPGGSHQWDIEPLRAAFSVVLDTDQVTSPIEIELVKLPPWMEKFVGALGAGEAELVIVGTRGEEHIPVPAIGQGPPPPKLEDLLG